MGFPETMYGWPQRVNSWTLNLENGTKTENDYVSRNGHRIKTTQPNSIILVSLFSEEMFYLMTPKHKTF